jgi:AcrR family transcriptional regulator
MASVEAVRRVPEVPTTPTAIRRVTELKAAAKVVFERDGYFATRVSDIAAMARVSHGTFYTYFESKDDILASLVVDFTTVTLAAMDHTFEPGTAYEHLEASIRHFLATYAEHAGMQGVLEQAVMVSEHFRQIRTGIRAKFVDRIADSIRALQARGTTDADLDAVHVANALGGMVEDYAETLYILRYPLDTDAAIRAMARIWARTVGIPEELTPIPKPRRRRAGGS